jgi:hypothetical protein
VLEWAGMTRLRQDKKWRRILSRGFLIAAGIVAALLLSEPAVRYGYYSSFDRAQGPLSLWLRHNNMYIEQFHDQGYTQVDHVVPHPYFFSAGDPDFRGLPPNRVQSRGIESRYPYPLERDPRYFSILILGGSVAYHLGMGEWNGKIWLQDYLNARYRSPNGKPFRVFCGADGGWRLPVQNNVMTLVGDGFDAFVAVDGYNEALNTKYGVAIDLPPLQEFAFLTNPPDAPWGLKALWALHGYRRLCFRYGVAQRSFLSFFIFERSAALLNDDQAYWKYLTRRLGRYFELPQDWDRPRRDRWNRRKYATYIKLQAAQARALDARYAHFVQPVHEIDKTLSEEEKRLPSLISARDYYDVIVPGSEDARRSGLPSFLLLDVFQNDAETLYADHIHCRFTGDGGNPGYDKMSRRIAELLGRAWRLRGKER